MGDRAADRSRARRPAWLPLAAAALVVPTVLAGLTLLWPRQQIEGELSRTAGAALAGAGLTGDVTVVGRDVTISGVGEADRQRAIDVVQPITGVRVAGFPDAGAGGSDDSAGTGGAGAGGAGAGGAGAGGAGSGVPAEPFGVTRSDGNVVLTGVVGSTEEQARLAAAAAAMAGGNAVIDQLTVTPGAALPPGVDAASIGAATAAVAGAGGDVAVSITPDRLLVTGAVASAAASNAIEQALRAALPGITVDNQLSVAGAGELDAAAKLQLQAQIDRVLAVAPITFEPDSPLMTDQGGAALAKVYEVIIAAPGARLQVDGFVASGPGAGRLTAQELSDKRAAVVRDGMVAGGVPADRIIARGLGEGPTPAVGATGRRVEITVV